MKVAVLTLTRDRLAYTQHCFAKLKENAGCVYDHYVLDNGSTDGTADWLRLSEDTWHVETVDGNIGICRGMNRLLDALDRTYDVIVKFDNDCELTTPDTLKTAAEIVHKYDKWIVSPHIQGLQNPPAIAYTAEVLGHKLGAVAGLGGIFMAVPGWVFNDADYRYNEDNPVWGMDDVNLSVWFREHGGALGYLTDFPAWHYKTTDGQWADPDQKAYYDRKASEFAS